MKDLYLLFIRKKIKEYGRNSLTEKEKEYAIVNNLIFYGKKSDL